MVETEHDLLLDSLNMSLEERERALQHIATYSSAPLAVAVVKRVKLKKIPHRSITVEERVSVGAHMYFFTKMPWTKNKNGVLIFIALQEKQVRIIADTNAWRDIGHEEFTLCARLLEESMANDFGRGLLHSINQIGNALIRIAPAV